MSDAMAAEFDTVAKWTAEVASELGPDYVLPAACRGSGSPAVLQYLIEQLGITATDRMLDCGAGVGGPGAFAADRVGVRPVLTDPEPGACSASQRLFGLPVVRAGSGLPFRAESFDVIWCLAVLCTVGDQLHLLRELRRVLAPAGRCGLLVYLASELPLAEQPEGNNFPTAQGLQHLLIDAGWEVRTWTAVEDFEQAQPEWRQRSDEVDAELARRHRGDPVWDTAEQQSQLFGELLARGDVNGHVLVLVARPLDAP